MRKLWLLVSGAGAALAAGVAAATPQAAVDVTDVTGTITNQLTSVSAIGTGILSAVVLITAFSLMKRVSH
jgi:uncharacterized membrane protein